MCSLSWPCQHEIMAQEHHTQNVIGPFLGRYLIIIITHGYDFISKKRSFLILQFKKLLLKNLNSLFFLATLKLKIARFFSVMWVKISQAPLGRLPTVCIVCSFEASPPPALCSFECDCTSSVLVFLLLLPSCASGMSSSMRAIWAKSNQFHLLRWRCLCWCNSYC